MPALDAIHTPRLLLRAWRDSDREPFAELNADPAVMEHFAAPLTRTESDALATVIMTFMTDRGFGLWAVEMPARPGTAEAGDHFVGFVGLSIPHFEAHFTPCVEIGWRIKAEHWGKGIATEAAQAALDAAFGELGLGEVVSFTSVGNMRSRRVMERLGMRHDPREDFDHPRVPEGHPLRRHVLYRIRPR